MTGVVGQVFAQVVVGVQAAHHPAPAMQPHQGLAAVMLGGCVAAYGNLLACCCDVVVLNGNVGEGPGAQQACLQFAHQAAALHIVQPGCHGLSIELGKVLQTVREHGINRWNIHN